MTEPQLMCGYSFDTMMCVAPRDHDGPHITSNERFPHGLPRADRVGGSAEPVAPPLLPCPFCGCEGVAVEMDGAWVAGCDAGQTRADDDMTCRANGLGFYHRTRAGAIAAWNRRAVARAPQGDPPEPGVVDVVAAVRRDSAGRYWLCRRNGDGAHGGLAGMWEYPGGKVEPGEQLRDALVRELQEEFGIQRPLIGAVLDSIEYQGYRVTFFEVLMQEPAALYKHSEVRWMTADEARRVEHLPSGTIFNARHLGVSAPQGDAPALSDEQLLAAFVAGCNAENELNEAELSPPNVRKGVAAAIRAELRGGASSSGSAPGWPDDSMLEAAWGLIANANEGDWEKAHPDWLAAAVRWRDTYHRRLGVSVGSAPPNPGDHK